MRGKQSGKSVVVLRVVISWITVGQWEAISMIWHFVLCTCCKWVPCFPVENHSMNCMYLEDKNFSPQRNKIHCFPPALAKGICNEGNNPRLRTFAGIVRAQPLSTWFYARKLREFGGDWHTARPTKTAAELTWVTGCDKAFMSLFLHVWQYLR